MFHDHGCGLFKFTYKTGTGIHIQVIVVRHLLPLDRFCTRYTPGSVNRRFLVRVFPVPQRPSMGKLDRKGCREFSIKPEKIITDGSIVCGRPGKGLLCELQALFRSYSGTGY